MPWFRTLLWIGTICLMIVLSAKSYRLVKSGVPRVESFEFAGATEARDIVQSWENASAMRTVISSIKLDYLFIAFYVLLMINCSNHQMNLERNLILNNLLRFNIALAIDTGLLDIVENAIMIHNIRSIDDHISTAIIATLKFVFAGWIILVWVVSVLKGAAAKKAYV